MVKPMANEEKSRLIPAARNCLKPEIPILNLHRRADVNLHADKPVEAPVFRVVVYDDAHHVAVEDVREIVAADDDVKFIPAIVIDEGLERLRVAERTDDLGLGGVVNMHHLPAAREKRPDALLIVLAGVAEWRLVSLRAIYVRLITGERPLGVRELDAAVIDAAVALRADAILDLQLKIFWRAAAPDDERVSLDDRRGRDFAHEAAVFDAPVFRVAVPAVERFAVEDLHEAGFVVGGDGRRALLLRARGMEAAK